MWRELFLFAVVIPAGMLTAGFIIFKKYAKSPTGKISKIMARQSEAEKLNSQYQTLLKKDWEHMSADDFDTIMKLQRKLDHYDKMVERKS